MREGAVMRVRMTWWWVVPILLVTTFLGSVLLTYDALWFDEWITYFITNTGNIGADVTFFGTTTASQIPICDQLGGDVHTPLHMICIAAMDNSWPPLFFGLVMLWEFVSGNTYFIDRTLALFIGLIGVSFTYQMARTMVDKKTGILAAALLGTTIFFTFYLHEIRGYTLYATVPAILGWFYWRLLNNPKAGFGVRAGFVVSIIAMLYTHYIGIAVVMGIGIYHLLYERPENLLTELREIDEEEDRSPEVQHWLKIFKLYINGCLSYGLWIGVLAISFYNESLNPRSVGLVSLLWTMVRGFSNNLWFIALPAIGLTLVRWQDRAVRFLWVWSLTILAVSAIGNLAADFLFHPRHIMGMMPQFATLVAIGLVIIGQRTTPYVSVSFLAVWMSVGVFYGLSPTFMNNIPEHIDAVPRSAMDTIVETLDHCSSETDTYIFGWNIPEEEWVQDQIVDYYLHGYDAAGVTMTRILSDEQNDLNGTTLMPGDIATSDVDTRFGYFVDDAERVHVFYLPNRPIEDHVSDMETLLTDDGWVACPTVERDDLVGAVYVRDGAQCEAVVASCGVGE